MKNEKPRKLFGNTPGTPFNFDVNKNEGIGHTMIFGPTGAGKTMPVDYSALKLSDAEMEFIKNGRL